MSLESLGNFWHLRIYDQKDVIPDMWHDFNSVSSINPIESDKVIRVSEEVAKERAKKKDLRKRKNRRRRAKIKALAKGKKYYFDPERRKFIWLYDFDN